MATNPPNDPAQPPVPPVPVVPRPTTAPPEPVSTVPVAPTPPPPTVPVNPTPAAPAPAPPAPPTPPVVSTRDTSLLDEAQRRQVESALDRPTETIPTREEWAAAGYPPEKYDERFGPNAVPTPRAQQYFCLEAAHPGGASGRADLFDVGRHFTFTGHGAPTCPICKRVVSAVLVADNTKLPPSIQTVKDRLEVAERAAR